MCKCPRFPFNGRETRAKVRDNTEVVNNEAGFPQTEWHQTQYRL